MEQESALSKLRQEMEDPLCRAEREREELQEELRSLQHDRDQSLLQAETEKQQVRFQPPRNPPPIQQTAAEKNRLFFFTSVTADVFPSPLYQC